MRALVERAVAGIIMVISGSFCGDLLWAQDALNQVVIVNSGQFGDPSERSTIASFNPSNGEYLVMDTLPGNSIQDVVIEGDHAYVAAQGHILRYDLDRMERDGMAVFPGVSAHQLELYEDWLLATNFYGQEEDNLYVLNRHTMEIVDTIGEIRHPGGTMAVLDGLLFVSQNEKGAIDLCPPWGCLQDTAGYLSVVDLATLSWTGDIPLDNNGSECGRIIGMDSVLLALNEVSGTLTTFEPSTGVSSTFSLPASINTSRYRTEIEVVGGRPVSIFEGGIGVLTPSFDAVEMLTDTLLTAFAYDMVNGHYYGVATDFFSYNRGYIFDQAGTFVAGFPVGVNPEAVAVHYNHRPSAEDIQVEGTDTIIIDVHDFATDPDGDDLVTAQILEAPLNGLVSLLPEGVIRYISLSPGSADEFRVRICDNKLNPLCTDIAVTVSPAAGRLEHVFKGIRLYPNPVAGRLQSVGIPDGSRFVLYDASGRCVGLPGDRLPDMEGLPAGSYFLQIFAGGTFASFPLIKVE